MRVTRRDMLKVAAAMPVVVAAKGSPSLQPIVVDGGTRLYPTWDESHWWTTQPIPDDDTWTYRHAVSLGASPARDGATAIVDLRNTPRLGVFTRAYFQFATPPLDGPQTLDGVVSAAIHAVQHHRRLGSRLALQVLVHRPDSTVRGVALPLRADMSVFTSENPPKTRAAQNWALQEVHCQDGDVIAINLGLTVDNQSRSLAYLVGFNLYDNQEDDNGAGLDIRFLDDSTLGNTWVEFSSELRFQNPASE
jgi:hypothetical protein